MKVGKEDLVRINKGFGGSLRSASSLEFAIEKQKNNSTGEYKKLAYLFRTILVDCPFSDGNKRTATFLAFQFADQKIRGLIRSSLSTNLFQFQRRI